MPPGGLTQFLFEVWQPNTNAKLYSYSPNGTTTASYGGFPISVAIAFPLGTAQAEIGTSLALFSKSDKLTAFPWSTGTGYKMIYDMSSNKNYVPLNCVTAWKQNPSDSNIAWSWRWSWTYYI